MQGFQPGPLFGLGGADKGDGFIGKNGASTIEGILNSVIPVIKQVVFDNALKSGFAVAGCAR